MTSSTLSTDTPDELGRLPCEVEKRNLSVVCDNDDGGSRDEFIYVVRLTGSVTLEGLLLL